MSETPQVSIVLPVYNQAGHVEHVVRAYDNALSRIQIRYELILVVNGAADDSLAVCQKIEAGCSAVKTVFSQRVGWGEAVRTGIKVGSGSLMCFANSARTGPEDLVLMILYAIANPGRVIKANRRKRGSLIRRMGSLFYNLECRFLFDMPYWDINGTPKVFPCEFDKLLGMQRPDDLLDLEFNLICRSEGYPMLEVPIFSTRRFGGRSTTTFWSAVRLYVGAYKIWRKRCR